MKLENFTDYAKTFCMIIGLLFAMQIMFDDNNAHAQQSYSLPDGDEKSAEYITMGCGLASIQECEKLIFDIVVPSTRPNLHVSVLNGNMHGGLYQYPGTTNFWMGIPGATGDIQLDVSGSVLFPVLQNQAQYDLYGEPTFPIVPVLTVSGDTLGEIQDGFVDVFNVTHNDAWFPSRQPGDDYKYRLIKRMEVRNPGISQVHHLFKLSANSPFSTRSKVGFNNKLWNFPPFIGLTNDILSDNVVEFSFIPEKVLVDGEGVVCILDAYNGDYDYWYDTDNIITPALIDLPFNITTDTREQAINEGNPPDKTVSISFFNPDGTLIYKENNPSGNSEWELTRFTSALPGCNNDNTPTTLELPELQDGTYSVVVNDLLPDNTVFNVFPQGGIIGTCEEDCEPVLPPQGCTPGYWKQSHHFDSWMEYSPNDSFFDVFGVGPDTQLKDTLMLQGGGENAFLRHVTAALLNTTSINYFIDTQALIKIVVDTYADGNFESVKDLLANQNEAGCPLN